MPEYKDKSFKEIHWEDDKLQECMNQGINNTTCRSRRIIMKMGKTRTRKSKTSMAISNRANSMS